MTANMHRCRFRKRVAIMRVNTPQEPYSLSSSKAVNPWLNSHSKQFRMQLLISIEPRLPSLPRNSDAWSCPNPDPETRSGPRPDLDMRSQRQVMSQNLEF
jgi:hypothetical protein